MNMGTKRQKTLKAGFILTTLIGTLLFGVEIPTALANKHAFGAAVELNSKVIQLSNAKQSIMALIGGQIETYYVGPGQKVEAGQKIALIKSIELSKMTADYISLKKQFSALNKNYQATKSLYEKGMASIRDVNLQSIRRNAMLSQIAALESQLKTLEVNTSSLKKASADYSLYAHDNGKVSELLQPLHSVIGKDVPIVTIVKEYSFYIQSYLPLAYAERVKIGQKIVVSDNKKELVTHITQILPELDEKTQRIIVLSSLDKKADDLYLNAYLPSTLYLNADKEYIAVKKSALSFFNNEWVVFVPGKESGQEEDEIPYEPRVVNVVAQDERYVGVEGIEAGEAYASDKAYYVKSMLLKSSLGDGD